MKTNSVFKMASLIQTQCLSDFPMLFVLYTLTVLFHKEYSSPIRIHAVKS